MAEQRDDVGAAITGQDVYDQFRRRTDIADRQNEAWPGPPTTFVDEQGNVAQELPQTLSPKARKAVQEMRADTTRNVPVTPLGRQAGLQDIKRPSSQELMQFLMQIDYMNTPQGIAEYERVNPQKGPATFDERFTFPATSEQTAQRAKDSAEARRRVDELERRKR